MYMQSLQQQQHTFPRSSIGILTGVKLHPRGGISTAASMHGASLLEGWVTAFGERILHTNTTVSKELGLKREEQIKTSTHLSKRHI